MDEGEEFPLSTQTRESFKHLTEPIKDLVSNWQVDVAAELGDYLAALEDVHFSFDNGVSSLNFAEAALLIQGSACIYSKKVEYLHSLCFQALEMVAASKKRAAAAQNPARGAGAGDEDEDAFGQDEAFLNLDDLLEEAEGGIDLDDDYDAEEEEDEGDLYGSRRGAGGRAFGGATPALMLALDGGAAGPGEDSTDLTCFRVSACVVHRSGALLLEPRDGDFLDEHLRPLRPPPTPPRALGPLLLGADGGGGPGPARQAAPGAAAEGMEVDPPPAEWDAGGGGYDDGDDGGGYDGWEAGGGAAGSPGADAAGAPPGGPVAPAAAEQAQAAAEEEQVEEEAEEDPYTPLDPDDPSGLPLKPLRRGRTYRPLAPAATLPPGPSLPAAHTVPLLPSTSTGLCFKEFEYALGTGKADRKGGHRGAGAGAAAGAGPSAEGAGAAGAPFDDGFDDDGGDGGGDDDGLAPGDDFDEDFGGVDFGLAGAAFGGLAGDTLAGRMEAAARLAAAGAAADARGSLERARAAAEVSYEELCRAHVDSFLAAAAAEETQTETAARVAAWKARVDPAVAAQEARTPFNIHSYGTSVLQRLLEIGPAPPEHPPSPGASPRAASAAAAAAALAAGEAVPFAAVVADVPAYEVCRVFAATLQLVNDGNVALEVGAAREPSAAGPLAGGPGPRTPALLLDAAPRLSELRLRLLNATAAHGVEDFRAPSLQQAGRAEGEAAEGERGASNGAAREQGRRVGPAAAAPSFAPAAAAPAAAKKAAAKGKRAADENAAEAEAAPPASKTAATEAGAAGKRSGRRKLLEPN